MNHQLIIATVLMAIFSATTAFNFNVNWVQNPKENLNAWSSRMRFQINDNLVFKSDDQADSVLVVKKQDFDSCSVSSPIQKLQGGSSNFQLTRSGPYYFISGDAQKCMNGQKMMVVVLSPRGKKQTPASPMGSPVPSLTSSPSMPPSMSPSSSSMAPSSSSPSMSPSSSSMAPSLPSPSMAPSSSSMAPSSSSSSTAPMPFTAETTPGPGGSEGPASAPKAMSGGPALGVAAATTLFALIVANVFLA